MMYSNRDIADYYNQTQNHYQKWWKLEQTLAVHYGIWDKGAKIFAQALANTRQTEKRTINLDTSNAKHCRKDCGNTGFCCLRKGEINLFLIFPGSFRFAI